MNIYEYLEAARKSVRVAEERRVREQQEASDRALESYIAEERRKRDSAIDAARDILDKTPIDLDRRIGQSRFRNSALNTRRDMWK